MNWTGSFLWIISIGFAVQTVMCAAGTKRNVGASPQACRAPWFLGRPGAGRRVKPRVDRKQARGPPDLLLGFPSTEAGLKASWLGWKRRASWRLSSWSFLRKFGSLDSLTKRGSSSFQRLFPFSVPSLMDYSRRLSDLMLKFDSGSRWVLRFPAPCEGQP